MRLPADQGLEVKFAALGAGLAVATKVMDTLKPALGTGATLGKPKKTAAIVPMATAGGMPGSATNPFGSSAGSGRSAGPKGQQTDRSAQDAIKSQNQLNSNLSGGSKMAIWNPLRKPKSVAGDYLEGAGHAALDAVEDAKRPQLDSSHLRELEPQRHYV